MNDDVIMAVMDYTPDKLFHAMYGETEMTSVMDMSVNDLAHHGILGQKWGIRRFQPYQPGAKVKGGKEVGLATKVKQRVGSAVEAHKAKSAAKAEVRAVRKQAKAEHKAAKQQAKEEKRAADYEASKRKAIESGTIEDLAKFKGDLTNEEYGRAFLRLQNEKKMADMMDANKSTMWDKIDKGMKIVQKVSGYADTIATAKGNLDKLDKAFNGEKKEDQKKLEDNNKNRALTQITNITELDEVQKAYKLTPDEYSKGLGIISKKEAGKKLNEEIFTNQDKAKETPIDGEYRTADNVRKNASYDNSSPSDFDAPKHAYDKAPKSVREKASYVNPDGECSFEEAGKRAIKGFNTSSSPSKYSSTTLRFGEETVRRLYQNNNNYSDLVKSVRKTVTDTQTESARQKEVDKKRRS